MSKKKDDWIYDYPSGQVRRVVTGDGDPRPYWGEANKLLYQVKNQMTFNNLGQLSLTRFFENTGVSIFAASAFGQDYIQINTEGGIPVCEITLIDVPDIVPPMMWYPAGEEVFTKNDEGVWVIINPDTGEPEVEGVDYIKTYYSDAIINCPSCTPLELSFAENLGAIAADTPQPFIYKSEEDDGTLIYNYNGAMVPHYMGYVQDPPLDPIPANPLWHTIYSFYQHGQAEIIKFDSDKEGSYFLWKAYTEWSNVGPQVVDFTLTGLGYMLMQGFIENQGVILCESDPIIIKVDCCEKVLAKRQIKLWWELGPPPFIFYGNIKLYEVPEKIRLWQDLYFNVCLPSGGVLFYTIPDINGSCLPITWKVEGRGTIEVHPHPTDHYGYYVCPDPNPYVAMDCGDVIISATDRCGTIDTVTATCCDTITPGVPYGLGTMSIEYTSLVLSASAEQHLVAHGGCPPYSWSVMGSGSLKTDPIYDPPRPANDVIIYTAPPSNSGCANNDGVVVSDCCGKSTSVNFNVNVGGYAGIGAFSTCTISVVGCQCIDGVEPNCLLYAGYYTYRHTVYDCFGDVIHQDGVENTYYSCNPNPLAACPCPGKDCMISGSTCCHGQEPNSTIDVRTPGMIAAGCCPINPLTGAPF